MWQECGVHAQCDVFRSWLAVTAVAALGLLLALALSRFAAAQTIPGLEIDIEEAGSGGLPAAGADSEIVDPQGFFNRDPKTRDRILGVMRAMQEKHGFRILLVIEPFLLDTDVHREAAMLQERLLPKGDGMVVVFESDSRRIGMSRAMSEANEGPAGIAPRVPQHVMIPLSRGVLSKLDPEQAAPKLLESLVFALAVELDAWFGRPEPAKAGTRHLRVMLLLLGFGSIVGLLMMAARDILNRPGTRDDPVRRFPDVDVPERLGAPYGGGHIASRKFRE